MSSSLPDHHRALRERAALVDRSARGRLRLTGADRRSYLQGLLTNDIEALTAGSGCYAALLTPQGRMIADMRVLETGDAVLLDLPSEVTQVVFDRLEGFVFSEDVQVSNVTSAETQVGVYGPQSARVLARVFGASAAEEFASLGLHQNVARQFDGAQVVIARGDDAGVDGFEIFAPAGAGDRLREALSSAGAGPVSSEAVEVCRVEAGRPLFGIDMDTDTIPLEAGIEDRAISLTKGCYVGQEIIIRVLHRGHGRVARRLVGLTLQPPAGVPARGDRILAGERQIGSVTSAVRSPTLDRAIALGYVHRDFTAPGTEVTIGDGTSAAVTALPFVDQPESSPVR